MTESPDPTHVDLDPGWTADTALVPPGGTVALASVAYHGVRNSLDRMQSDGRLSVRMIQPDDTDAVIAAADSAGMVWVESIASPLTVVADIPA
jgi:cystathionine gamma-synthase